MNTFTVDTDWRVLPKGLSGKWCQDLQKPCSIILRFVLTNHMYVYCRLAHLKKKCWFSAVYYRIWLEGYQIIFVRSSSLAKGQQTFKIKPVNIQSRSSSRTLIKRTPADMELSIYLKPYIYLYSYKTETVIFIATKHEKTIMAVIFV